MNKETYEALKRIIYTINDVYDIKPNQKDIKQVEEWIDEVAKEYEEDYFEEWVEKNKDKLEEDYEFDVSEAFRLKDTADYGSDSWKELKSFDGFCRERYEAEKEE